MLSLNLSNPLHIIFCNKIKHLYLKSKVRTNYRPASPPTFRMMKSILRPVCLSGSNSCLRLLTCVTCLSLPRGLHPMFRPRLTDTPLHSCCTLTVQATVHCTYHCTHGEQIFLPSPKLPPNHNKPS